MESSTNGAPTAQSRLATPTTARLDVSPQFPRPIKLSSSEDRDTGERFGNEGH